MKSMKNASLKNMEKAYPNYLVEWDFLVQIFSRTHKNFCTKYFKKFLNLTDYFNWGVRSLAAFES